MRRASMAARLVVAALVVVGVVAGPLVSCAHRPSEVRTAAYVAKSSAGVLDGFGRVLETRVRADEWSAAKAATTRQEGEAALAAVRTRYAPVLAAYEAARLAHRAYVEAVLEAIADERTEVSSAFRQRLRITWTEMVAASVEAGLPAPAVPESQPPESEPPP